MPSILKFDRQTDRQTYLQAYLRRTKAAINMYANTSASPEKGFRAGQLEHRNTVYTRKGDGAEAEGSYGRGGWVRELEVEKETA